MHRHGSDTTIGIRCIENKKNSYRENAIQAKMQSRRREQRGDDQDSPLKISKAYKSRLLLLR